MNADLRNKPTIDAEELVHVLRDLDRIARQVVVQQNANLLPRKDVEIPLDVVRVEAGPEVKVHVIEKRVVANEVFVFVATVFFGERPFKRRHPFNAMSAGQAVLRVRTLGRVATIGEPSTRQTVLGEAAALGIDLLSGEEPQS